MNAVEVIPRYGNYGNTLRAGNKKPDVETPGVLG